MNDLDKVTYFGAADARGKNTPFGIRKGDRERHMYIIGKTGMGKSTLLENLAIQDINNGEGLAFIDPHGSTAETLLEYVPKHRVKDVVYFAPFDLDNPIAFNVMEDVGYDKRHLVVSGLMSTFNKILVDAWSARMEYILTNTLLALLEYPGATLLGVNRMYVDKEYRNKVVENITDPVVKDFWTKEFAGYTDRFTQEATPAIQNKVGQFTSNPVIRNIIGQEKSSFDIRELMDQKKILIINLSKGQVGDTNAQLLGSMLTTRLYLAAMSRADLRKPELNKLPPFYFYVDEFQNFANETFAEILSEARKYKLNLIIAHQYIEQMEEEVRNAVFGNVGTTVSFRVGPFDAEVLETVFTPNFTKEDLVNLGQYQIYLTLMINGVGSQPFSARTIPPIEAPEISYREDIIKNTQETYGHKRAEIEGKILESLSPLQPAAKSMNQKKSQDKKQEPQKPKSQPAPKKKETKQNEKSLEDLRATLKKVAGNSNPPKKENKPENNSLKAALKSAGVQKTPEPKSKTNEVPEEVLKQIIADDS
jgi:energy-coupling factor transporter ATP-binding protein EcfA2